MRWMLAVAAVALAAHPAFAQAPGDTPPLRREKKTLLGAYLTTVAATTGPVVAGLAITGFDDSATGPRAAIGGTIATAGLLFGPSAGPWYAGESFWSTGLALRAGGLATIGVLAVADPYLEHPSITIPGLFGAVGLIATGFVWDGATTVIAVRRHNRARDHVVVPVITGNSVGLAGAF